ncbi:MAG: sigma-70 family RNA polymerase sigma factor, partial [Chloroflexi bacterium]|nr:sigma-70 family RNA polymerase sigma factor [Chloroflexota bacterium]
YQRYVARIYSYMVLKTGRQDAGDLTADVFTRALEGIRRFQPDRSFQAWLFGIARNRVREHMRGSHMVLEQTEVAAGHADDPEEFALSEERIRLARSLVASLPSPQREIIELRYWAGLPIQDIARIVGKSEGAVRVVIHRTLHGMKRQLETNQ